MADQLVYPSLVDVGPSLRPLRIPPPSAADDGDAESPLLRRISDGVQRTVFSLDQDVGLDITVLLLTFSDDGASAQDSRERNAGGLLPEEIEKTMKVRAASDGEEGLCAVCLDGLGREEEDDRTVGVLTCDHEFHVSCIRQWLMKKNQCPLCRAIAL